MGEVVLTDKDARPVFELHTRNERQWMPVLRGATSNSGQIYTKQAGLWMKLGHTVRIEGYVALSARGSFAGAISLTGLPFVPDLSPDPTFRPGVSVTWFQSLQRNHVWLGGEIAVDGPLGPRIDLFGMRNAGMEPDPLVQADFNNFTVLRVSGWYPTAS